MRIFLVILLFLFIYIESSLFVSVSNYLGVAAALLLLIASSVLGFVMLTQQGLRTLFLLPQMRLDKAQLNYQPIKSITLFFIGVLFLLPGFFTDILACLLLILPFQRALLSKLFSFMTVSKAVNGQTRQTDKRDNKGYTAPDPKRSSHIIEGEFRRKEDES